MVPETSISLLLKRSKSTRHRFKDLIKFNMQFQFRDFIFVLKSQLKVVFVVQIMQPYTEYLLQGLERDEGRLRLFVRTFPRNILSD